MWGAHPRSRGENAAGYVVKSFADGSSPLTRGKRPAKSQSSALARLIPAHAGKTSFGCRGLRVALGSSPLTRGKQIRPIGQLEKLGLIPAHAGKTTARCGITSIARAHPRSRGENCVAWPSPTASKGSSPLTRGKRDVRTRQMPAVRLIPAHAGKTRGRKPAGRGGRAHPRSRGENASVRFRGLAALGSSPLTRGKRTHSSATSPPTRLIPAHAGKTQDLNLRPPGSGAHPRSRGENRDRADTTRPGPGSSPLTRGKRIIRSGDSTRRRLIPAHAGKTAYSFAAADARAAHPRSRGENARSRLSPPPVSGSSPLTRGKRARPISRLGTAGLIPAHAGKTLPDMRFYCADRSDLGNP